MQSSGDSTKIQSLFCGYIGKIHHLHGIGFFQESNNTAYIFDKLSIHFSKVRRTFNSTSSMQNSGNPSDSGKIR